MITDTYKHQHVAREQRQAATSESTAEIDSFICLMDDGWYVEYSDGENGPFDSLREAQTYWEAHPQRKTA